MGRAGRILRDLASGEVVAREQAERQRVSVKPALFAGFLRE
jgi:hypothetical protein